MCRFSVSFGLGREAEVCNSIRGKVAKGGIIPTGRERERESMTSQPSWPPLRGALKDSSANLMILQRPGLQSAARRRSLDTDPHRSLLAIFFPSREKRL